MPAAFVQECSKMVRQDKGIRTSSLPRLPLLQVRFSESSSGRHNSWSYSGCRIWPHRDPSPGTGNSSPATGDFIRHAEAALALPGSWPTCASNLRHINRFGRNPGQHEREPPSRSFSVAFAKISSNGSGNVLVGSCRGKQSRRNYTTDSSTDSSTERKLSGFPRVFGARKKQ